MKYTPILIMVAIVAGLALAITVFSPTSERGIPRSAKRTSSTPSATPAQLYTVTAYCPKECCCGKYADGTTASGHAAVGLIVAAPSTIPFGTVLSIPGYGRRAEVQDRGGAIKGMKLDVLFATHQEAKEWGVKELMVRIVK